VLISPEHFELNERYRKLLVKSMQQEKIIERKDREYKEVSSKIDALRSYVDDFTAKYKDLHEHYVEAVKIIKQKDKEIEELQLIKHQFEQLKKLVFGSKSEKSVYVSPDQLSLQLAAETIEACNINDGQRIASYTKAKKEKNENHPGRKGIPAHLRREYVDIYPNDLPGDAELFDTEETEQLEYDLGRLFATVYRRFKYKRTNADGKVEFFIGDLPLDKDKCLAAPSLRAHCIVEKYMYHMPLYRQMQKFAQEGVIIAANTMSDWVNNDARSLTALYDAHRSCVLNAASQYMMADETGFRVLDLEKVKGKKSHRGQMWAYANPADGLVFFEYQQGRSRKHARPMLDKFRGILHTDGFGVYDHFAMRNDIVHANCNAHARRKFEQALFTSGEKTQYVLEQYRKLYAVEKHCREQELNFDQRLEIRREKSVPVFNELASWCKDQLINLRSDEKKSPIKTALGYFCAREEELSRFLHYGMLEIDTNLIERSIRPIALGRKNYMFAGSHEAAQNAAMIYSLLATCKLQNVYSYQSDQAFR
jgi:transposase